MLKSLTRTQKSKKTDDKFLDECPLMESEEKSRRLLSKAIKVIYHFCRFFSSFSKVDTNFQQICERKIESQCESQQAKPVACRRGFSEPVATPISNFNRRKNKKGLSLTI